MGARRSCGRGLGRAMESAIETDCCLCLTNGTRKYADSPVPDYVIAYSRSGFPFELVWDSTVFLQIALHAKQQDFSVQR